MAANFCDKNDAAGGSFLHLEEIVVAGWEHADDDLKQGPNPHRHLNRPARTSTGKTRGPPVKKPSGEPKSSNLVPPIPIIYGSKPMKYDIFGDEHPFGGFHKWVYL